MLIKVIMKAKDIPNGSMIQKVRGSTLYKIVDLVILYNENKEQRKLTNVDGAKFLIGGNFEESISCVSAETELVWNVEDWEFVNYLDNKRLEK